MLKKSVSVRVPYKGLLVTARYEVEEVEVALLFFVSQLFSITLLMSIEKCADMPYMKNNLITSSLISHLSH